MYSYSTARKILINYEDIFQCNFKSITLQKMFYLINKPKAIKWKQNIHDMQ